MKNKIFFLDTCSESRNDFFERELPGSVYDDSDYSLLYDGKTYDVFVCTPVGFNLGDVCIFRLEEIPSQ